MLDLKKDTSELLKELQSCSDFKSFYNENEDQIIKKDLSTYLAELIKQKGILRAEAVRKSELSEAYAYQIFSGVRKPERRKLLSLAIGMGLDLDEVQTLLKCGGYAQLYVKSEFDSIVIFGICKHLSVVEINLMLFEHELETLG